MGVFSAMNAAVSGLTAQAYALENISGNIANVSTIGYKRLDTSFADMVSEGLGTQRSQKAGTVAASSRASNSVQGDLQQTQVETYMAINGDGYFSVKSRTSLVDGNPIFDNAEVYTRRGDFEIDKNGYLVNGADYYLMGLPVDEVTNNIVGSVPEIIRLDNTRHVAIETGNIEYIGNLPLTPKTARHALEGNDLLATSLIVESKATGVDTAAAGQDVGAAEISDNNTKAFLDSSLSGGSITTYGASGAPVDIQLRWAKTAAGSSSQNATWSLYYLTDASADGDEIAWKKLGDAQFNNDGRMVVPSDHRFVRDDISVNGVALDEINISFGDASLTQFANEAGNVKLAIFSQDGYPPGDLDGISINNGRIIASYSNGRIRELYDISLVSFAGDAGLRRLDGDAFAVTSESGPPVADADGVILGKTLEASNADIADEFSKLIIAQQAYSANTRIITTNDELLQEAINMIR